MAVDDIRKSIQIKGRPLLQRKVDIVVVRQVAVRQVAVRQALMGNMYEIRLSTGIS
jgi:hypothetical protein